MTEPDDVDAKELSPGDPLLVYVVGYAALGIELSLTLSIPGGVVSGTLVSLDKYLTLSAEMFADESYADVAPAVKFREAIKPDPEQALGTHRWLHLTNARYGEVAPPLPRTGFLLRLRIADVTSWAYGLATPS